MDSFIREKLFDYYKNPRCFGCAFCIASASMLVEHIIGKSVVYAKNFSSQDLFKLIGFQPVSGRVKCAVLGLSVLHNAIYQLN